ncbi:hypothetical protein HYS48_02655 [Candidatus Woesearchaeota archaeon]|nr:hypothetical protein [Candidatus Woesearchaeota archaeon]
MTQDRQRLDKNKYLAALAITTLIFLLGIFIGNKISQAKLSNIDTLEREIRTDVLGAELQYRLILENPCNVTDPGVLTEQLYEIGSRLDFMESELGKDNQQVLGLKEFYSMLEIQHWLLLRRTKAVCNKEYDLILYFYSNLGDCDACELQGHVLNYMHEKYPEINIYSFDINMQNPVLQTIRDLYRIQTPPTLIINDKVSVGFMNSQTVEEALELA